jgi:predicted metal-dependent hydrolase
MIVNAVHGLDVVRVDDLVLSVAPATARTTLEIVVERDATLVLKAPDSVTVDRAMEFVASKRSWIYRKLAEKDALLGPPVVKQFVDGEGFAYLGRSHRLLIDESADVVRLDRGRFVAPPAVQADGLRIVREWYVQAGTSWLRRRVRPWAGRMGFDRVSVDVRDLGYRWGSARPTSGEQRVNIHWATLQLPPSLVDYVLVHELVHLREANHTPEFWALVGQLMPGFESQKANLGSIGKNVWLGAVSRADVDGRANSGRLT